MNDALMVVEQESQGIALSVPQIKAQVAKVREILNSVMTVDVHYGTIPGTQKPMLYRAGCEKILLTFHLAAGEPVVEDLSSYDMIRYRVKQPIISKATGITMSYGIGECSSGEEKYMWRRPVCDAEFQETPEDRRREKWIKDKRTGLGVKVMQVRTNPADEANTVLKMANMRALRDAVLKATACSDIFAAGEDVEDEIPDSAPPAATAPRAKATPAPATPKSEEDDHPPLMHVAKAELLSGVNKVTKKEWTKYEITLRESGQKLSTFERSVYESAQAAIAGNYPVFVVTEQKKGKDGQSYTNIAELVPGPREQQEELPLDGE